MGNGPGGMSEYQELFDRHPRLMGGFVWEWLEHGITVTDQDGREHFAYGGDFGEEIHDGNFVTDGLVDADRNPRPGLLDFKKVIEPVRRRINPITERISVVLPAPLRPITPTMALVGTSSDTPRSTVTGPIATSMFLTSSI